MKRLLLCLFVIFSIFAMDNNAPKGKEPAEEAVTCSICLEDIEGYSTDPLLGKQRSYLTGSELFVNGSEKHVFHTGCITQHLKKGTGIYGCPLCRKPLKKELEEAYSRERPPGGTMRLEDLVDWPVAPAMGRSWHSFRDEGASHGEAELDGIRAFPEGFGWASRRSMLVDFSSSWIPVSVWVHGDSRILGESFDVARERRFEEVAIPFLPSFVRALRYREASPAHVFGQYESREHEGGSGCPR
jgi:hypothetical protein